MRGPLPVHKKATQGPDGAILFHHFQAMTEAARTNQGIAIQEKKVRRVRKSFKAAVGTERIAAVPVKGLDRGPLTPSPSFDDGPNLLRRMRLGIIVRHDDPRAGMGRDLVFEGPQTADGQIWGAVVNDDHAKRCCIFFFHRMGRLRRN